MPRKYRKRMSKKRYNKKRQSKWRKMDISIVRQPSIMADKLWVKLPYVQNLALSGTLLQSNTFRINSMFDPDQTGTGHQPLGFDQYEALYSRYRVHAVKAIITFTNTTSAVAVGAIAATEQIPSFASLPELLEQPYVTSRQLSYASGGLSTRTITKYISIRSLRGEEIKFDDDNSALFSSSPTNTAYLTVYASEIFGGSVTLHVNIKLIYYAELFRRKNLSTS